MEASVTVRNVIAAGSVIILCSKPLKTVTVNCENTCDDSFGCSRRGKRLCTQAAPSGGMKGLIRQKAFGLQSVLSLGFILFLVRSHGFPFLSVQVFYFRNSGSPRIRASGALLSVYISNYTFVYIKAMHASVLSLLFFYGKKKRKKAELCAFLFGNLQNTLCLISP